MDSLPVELLRLVFESCDVQSVKALRLVCQPFAQVGYEYLIPPGFTAVAWRDDVARLHSIASHERLRTSIQSAVFNFAEIDEDNGRRASYLQHYFKEPEKRTAVLTDAWLRYAAFEKRSKALAPFEDPEQAAVVRDAMSQLPNLSEIQVMFTRCPFNIDILRDVFEVPSCRKMDPARACKKLNVIVSAMQLTRVSSFTVDRLPLELFRMPVDRKAWFESADTFARLTRLDLTLDTMNSIFPTARSKSINGLGFVLRQSPNLGHLSLAFHNYGFPRDKFLLQFQELLLDGFTFGKLTDLRLGGIGCVEEDLRDFLVRHGTLERLRLGGRGLAKGYEVALGGIRLCRGTFRSLFTSLSRRLPNLQRLHMEGDFESEPLDRSVPESYNFHPTTDDQWNDVTSTTTRRVRSGNGKATTNSLALERFVLEGGTYPGSTADDSE